MMWGNSLIGFGFGWIFMVLWWALIIAGIVALIRWLLGQSNGVNGNKNLPLIFLKNDMLKVKLIKRNSRKKGEI